MAPIRPDNYEFAFDTGSIGAVRQRLGLSQAALADQLDVPVNTVSRWETGANSPDAKALAAIYSIAKSRNVTPRFFKSRTRKTSQGGDRTRAVVVWDFQNRSLDAREVEEEWGYIRDYLHLRFPRTRFNLHCRAYAGLDHSRSSEELKRLGFEVFAGWFDADSQVVNDVKVECRNHPDKTVLVLVADDGDYVDLIRELKQMDVDVLVLGTDECSERLRRAVGNGGYLPWDAPYVITRCVEVVREIAGNPITRSEFGKKCKNRLDEAEVYPGNVGYSKRNPYGSVLRWLEAHGIISTTRTRGKSNAIRIKLTI